MQPSDVIDHWFADGTQARWFEATAEFDQDLRDRFGALYARAAGGQLDHWRGSAEGCLALCLLLDQLPRNMFRDDPKAFATDAKALAVAEHAIAKGFDQGQPTDVRLFFYLPFEHCEDLSQQNRCIALIAAIGDQRLLDYAIRHHEVIARFGRFPHRNAVLGRATTPEEADFLKQPGSSF